VPSGLTATTLPLLALTSAGYHVLVTDSVYGPTRRFCNNHLTRLGVEVSYYDPLIGSGIEREMRPNTRAVFLESPGSLSFEVQDVSAIAAVAHAHDALVLLDNTWATPLNFRAFDHGVDVSLHAGTKYMSSHSDLLIGLIVVSIRPSALAGCGPHRRHGEQRRLFSGAAGLRRLRCAWTGTRPARCASRNGCAKETRSPRSSTRRCRAREGTSCGSAISPAPADCSAWS
jgi:hypothetical protein